ncbi:cytoplasm protein, putative [Cryptococcus deneoformans JEC21]|uniref:Cytoplasm protein, putative n=1 Tax=Cryptococcus deneoformans (strain JEC21 / ATCC MYA-565) TaxID=214684 RepID=Q5K9W9_CRYD1|nr:cytoplasm protein, putative [Cryptococcus neoformans var. neoformans JEC21]AAW46095.1 cytoplasm protein, putative [Cryptococcus neoformans var. neoformans JEC21]
MCGLTLSIRSLSTGYPRASLLDAFQSTITCRGPDTQGSYTHIVKGKSGAEIEITLSASVLGLRGELTAQPLVGKRGVLGWNGQVFEGLQVEKDANDTRKIFEKLEEGAEFQSVLKDIEGPFACIYLDLISSTLYYQLDPLSRRSLLLYPQISGNGTVSNMFILSSCCCGLVREAGLEMRALLGGEGGIIRFDQVQVLEDGTVDLCNALIMTNNFDLPESSSTPWTRVAPINTVLPPSGLTEDSPAIHNAAVISFVDHLQASVRRRVENIPDLAPGEAKVAVLFSGGIDCTFLAYLLHQCLPLSDPIDLINVSFAPSPRPQLANGKGKGKHKTPGVEGDVYAVPDRLSGLEAVEELRNVCKEREWRFVEVNVPYEEAREHRARVVELMYPSVTEMDLSLAYPLYFASLGKGSVVGEDGNKRPYQVKAKVYISGLGADEQLGGYSRHRHAFNQAGWQGLIEETQMDLNRLPTRNLSRDDRLISSHARDARYPYLSLSFIAYLSSLPIWLKCDPRLPPGQGDKRLLRLAVERVGMSKTGARVKRAMQFGTRSAKVGGTGSGVKGPKAGERPVEWI